MGGLGAIPTSCQFTTGLTNNYSHLQEIKSHQLTYQVHDVFRLREEAGVPREKQAGNKLHTLAGVQTENLIAVR